MEHPMVAHTMLILAIQAGYPIMVRHPYHATNKPAKLSYYTSMMTQCRAKTAYLNHFESHGII